MKTNPDFVCSFLSFSEVFFYIKSFFFHTFCLRDFLRKIEILILEDARKSVYHYFPL